MSDPRPELGALIARRWPGAKLDRLAGDASTRRFYRLGPVAQATCVIMDYGAPFDSETDDVRLTRVFRAAGLPVAGIDEVLPQPGCLILEDLGDRTLEAVVGAAPEAVAGSFEQAVRLAADVAARGTPALERSERASGPALDAERFRYEMDFFVEHYVGGLLGRPSPDRWLWDELHRLAARAADTPRRVLCHRDFHSRNLMLPPGGGLAMVDIQDARWGPDSYDLASLLFDAYVEIPDALRDAFVATYLDALPQPPAGGAAAFVHRLGLVAAQRMIKALGTFGHQATVRGRSGYLEGVPRTLARLEALLPAHDETARLGEHFRAAGLFTAP